MKRFCFAILLAFASGQTSAQETNEIWEEYGKRVASSGKVNAFGPDLFGDQVSLSNGALSFSVADVSVPGNNHLPVEFRRSFSVRGRKGAYFYADFPLADWEIDLPNIGGVFAPDWVSGDPGAPGKRCSVTTVGAARPPAVVLDFNRFESKDFWQGHSLSLPSGGGEMMLLDASHPRPSAGGPYYWVTGDQTRIACLPQIKNWSGGGEGFLAVAPDGTKYWFDWMAQYLEPKIESRTNGVPKSQGRRRNVLYPTRVEDRFGNWVTYTYTNARTAPIRLASIQSSDARRIDVQYNSDGRVSSVTAHGHTWQYQYAAVNAVDKTLASVALPDGSSWGINLAGLLNAKVEYHRGVPGEPWRSCTRQPDLVGPESFAGQITHPSGAVGDFTVKVQMHGRTNVPVNCDHFTSPHNDVTDDISFWPIYHHALSLAQKKVSGPGLSTGVWTYDYQPSRSFYYPSGDPSHPVCPYGTDCSIPRCTSDDCAGSSATTVTDPAGDWVRYRYGNSYRYNEGKLLTAEVGGAGSTTGTRVTTHTYDLSQTNKAYPAKWGTSPRMIGEGFTSEFHRPSLSTVIQQQGVTYSKLLQSHDWYANPVKTRRWSTLAGAPARTDELAYHHNTGKWVLGQIASTHRIEPLPALEVSSASYDPITAVPTVYRSFGKTVQTLAYNADGTVAWVRDGKNNATTLTSWYRGVPRAIQYADSSGASAVVNPSGWITQATDANGFATHYTYDVMGRLATIAYPTADSTAWSTTTQSFAQIQASEYGIPAGHWRQVVTTGTGEKVNYFDALWRPVVVRERDTANSQSTRFVRYGYDHDGRVTFASYPSAVDNPTKGVRTAYDALGRQTLVTQDSELGALTTKTEFLTGFRTRITNPRGKQTVTGFMAFDQPSTDWPVSITHPEGVFTDISRDVFGKPTVITRRNANSSLAVSRKYVYDAHQQLCKTLEPETGATVADYDAAGNVVWSASGLNLSSLTCDRGSVASGSRVTRTYDARNRLKTLVFPDGNGSQSWLYTADGLPSQITTQNDAGLTTAVNAYVYNKRRLLTGESISQPGLYTWSFGYGYNANGHLAANTYPGGLTVDYAPNALGQPTRAGTYATGVTYFPNGAMKQFSYGNSIVHTLQQNTRGMPDRSRDAYGTGQVVHDDGIDYDANGNVMAITDGANAGRGNRDMSYDALDRLTTTVSPMFGNASYGYDVLDNLTAVKTNARDHTYSYDANQRLTNVRNTVGGATVIGLGYDPRGNLQNKNGTQFQFDLGNRLRHVTGKESYRYDGHGRRIESINLTGENIFSMYDLGGVLRYQRDFRKRTNSEYVYLNGSLVAEVNNVATGPAVPALTVPATSSTGSYATSWTAATGAKTYRLEESANSGPWTEVVETTTLGWSASGRANGNYRYRVRSCALGCSGYSAIQTVTVSLIPQGAPTLTLPTYATVGNYTVSWSAISQATRYELHEQSNGGSWVQISNGAGGSKAIAGKASGTYGYRVRGCNDHGCAGWSAVKSIAVELPPASAPALTVPAQGLNGAYTVSWGAAAGATSFTLEESANGGSWTNAYTGAAASKAYSGKPAGTFAYRIKACNPAGCSALSASKSVAVIYAPAAAPALTTPATNTTGSYTVSWTAVAGSTKYQLEERPAGGSYATVHDAAGTSKAVSGKATGTYEYRGRACNAAGCGGYSAVKSTAVTRPPASAPALTVPASNTTGSYTVSWTAVAGATKFQLEERPAGGSYVTVHDAAGTSKAASGKASGTYEYRGRACNAGGCGGYSAVKAVQVTLPPSGAPTVSAPTSSTSGSYTVSWTAVAAATGYRLEERKQGAGWAEIHNAAATSKAVSGKTYATWDYRARACNAGGCGGYSAIKSVVVAPPPPPVPTGLTVKQRNPEMCMISWNQSSGATKYDLSNFSPGNIIYSGGVTQFMWDAGCANPYTVRACNAHSCSAWSAPAYSY